MANLTTSQLKKTFLNIICNNEKIIKLINNKDIKYPDELIGKNIFPQIKIDCSVLDQGTYIGLKIDYPSMSHNDTFKNYILTIMVLSHNAVNMTIYGETKTDLIVEELISLLNFNHDIGFTLELKNDYENPLEMEKDWYYRKVTFKSINFNSLDNKLNNGV